MSGKGKVKIASAKDVHSIVQASGNELEETKAQPIAGRCEEKLYLLDEEKKPETKMQQEEVENAKRKALMLPIAQESSLKIDIALLMAAKNNDVIEVKRLLGSKATLTQIDTSWTSHGWNALHWAVYHDNPEMITTILKYYPQAIFTKISGPRFGCFFPFFRCNQTPLSIAIDYNREKARKILQSNDNCYFYPLLRFWENAPIEICRLVTDGYLYDVSQDRDYEYAINVLCIPTSYCEDIHCAYIEGKDSLKSLCLSYIRQRIRIDCRVDDDCGALPITKDDIPDYSRCLKELDTNSQNAELYFSLPGKTMKDLRNYTMNECDKLWRLRIQREDEYMRKQEEQKEYEQVEYEIEID